MESKINENEGLLPAIVTMIVFGLIFFNINPLPENFNEKFFSASAILFVMSLLYNVRYIRFIKESTIKNSSVKFSILMYSALVVFLIAIGTTNTFHMLIEGILLLIIAGLIAIVTIDTRDQQISDFFIASSSL